MLAVDRTAPVLFNAGFEDAPSDGVWAGLAGRDDIVVTASANEPVASGVLRVGVLTAPCAIEGGGRLRCVATVPPDPALDGRPAARLLVLDGAGNESVVELGDITIDTIDMRAAWRS